jgi:alpha-beta hydrolase superfamily lysophospholipase
MSLMCVLLALAGCDTAGLEPWHTRILKEEYDAGKSDRIKQFEDYRKLESRLFAELDQRIYTRTPAGPGHELQRYSAGSIADPRGHAPDWNRSVELGMDNTRGGVLLLHGMSDSPYSLRALAQSMADRGYRVLALRLPGHGTIPSGLTGVRWEDMAAVTRLGMEHLRRELGDAPLHMIGYSTGAALAIHYSLTAKVDEHPASLVLISPAIGVSPAAALASWKRLASYVPGLRRLAWSGLGLEFDPYKYNSFATNAAEQVYRLTQAIRQQVHENPANTGRIPPTLVLKSAVDATVSVDAVIDNFLIHLSPGRNELVLFDVNRRAAVISLMREDPGPVSRRLLQGGPLPFALTLVSNTGPETDAVGTIHKPAMARRPGATTPLSIAWPWGVFSLSHVALPIPPSDPLYGDTAPVDLNQIYLGHVALRGEQGVLALPATFLLRLRHNPFYDYLETRTIDWIVKAEDAPAE